MPELPEVETVMRGLAAVLTGACIRGATLHRPDLRWPVPTGLPARLIGAQVQGFRRRGKYMFMRLAGGDSVLIHLGMSGRMTINQPAVLHQHFTFEADHGPDQRVVIGFIDPRRFGALDLVSTDAEDNHRLVAGLGPEPLDDGFNAATLAAALRGRATPIKTALLDQSVVAGLGNIYVSEALFRARIAPRRPAGTLGPVRIVRLLPSIKETLRDAIAAGGSSLRDYVQPSGELGYFQHAWKVYDRAGLACERCLGPPDCAGISRIVQSGRSTYFCPKTQR
jgi:formamidopyrimidine-DNA glycosylase